MTFEVPKGIVKVGVVPMENDFEVTKTNTGDISITGGIEGRFLDMLSTYVGFKYQLVIPPDGEWGVEKEDGNWTGIIGMVRKGDTDLGLGYMVMTDARHRAVNFSTPYSVADKTFVTNPPDKMSLTTAYTRPFSLEVWIGYLLLLILFPLLLSRLSSRKPPYVDVLIRIFGTFCKQPVVQGVEESTGTRVAFGSWCIFVTIVTLSYCAVLPSFVTVPLKEKSVDTIRDLHKAVEKGSIKCLAPKGSSELDVLFHSNHADVKHLGERIKANRWFYDLTNGTLADQLRANTALIGLRLWFSSPNFSGKILSTESFGVWNVGIALKKDFCCSRRLNAVILRILAAGLFDKLISDEFFETKVSRSILRREKLPDKIRTLSLNDMSGSFTLLIWGYFAGFVCLLGELVFKFSCS